MKTRARFKRANLLSLLSVFLLVLLYTRGLFKDYTSLFIFSSLFSPLYLFSFLLQTSSCLVNPSPMYLSLIRVCTRARPRACNMHTIVTQLLYSFCYITHLPLSLLSGVKTTKKKTDLRKVCFCSSLLNFIVIILKQWKRDKQLGLVGRTRLHRMATETRKPYLQCRITCIPWEEAVFPVDTCGAVMNLYARDIII